MTERPPFIHRICHFLLWHAGYFVFVITRVPLDWTSRVLSCWQLPNRRYLLRGVPALSMILATAAVLIAMCFQSDGRLRSRYELEARRNLQAKNFEAAQLCFERLLALGQRSAETRYRLALTAHALGQHDRAAAILAEVAPPDRQGYAPAHSRQAQNLLDTPNPSTAALRLAEAHLLRTLHDQPESVDAHGRLGQVYLATGQLAEAEPHLTKAVKQWPELRVPLARLHAVGGNRDEARRLAEAALSHFKAKSQANLDDHEARLKWAEAALFLEDFAGAASILEQGLTLTQVELYRRSLAQVYVAWSDAVAADSTASATDRWRLLEDAIRCDPANAALLSRLTALVRSGEAGAEGVRSVLRSLLAQGRAAGPAHFVLGFDAWHRGNSDEARVHWERAYEQAPHVAIIANNLAWLLAESAPEELPRALDLINSVIDQSPSDGRYRGTRGHIFVKMQRWKEALADLEAALPAYGNNKELHAELSQAYAQLGMSEMADEHRRLAAAR